MWNLKLILNRQSAFVTLFLIIVLNKVDILEGQRNQNQKNPNNNQFNPNFGQKYHVDEDDILMTQCRYVKGVVNTTYSKVIKNGESIVYIFYVERKYFLDSHNTNLRIEADVENATLQDPVMFSIGQRKYLSTFELPQVYSTEIGTSDNVPIYTSAARNLCIQRKGSNVEGQNVTVRVSTSSAQYVNFRMRLYLTQDFQLGIGKNLTVEISPTSPRYFGFQSMTPDMGVIKIKATSNTNSCMTLSVQTPYCPIYDKEVNIKYQGLWQTMTLQSAMTLELVNRFKDGFVVVLVAHDSDTMCAKSGYINPYEPPPMSNRMNKSLFGLDFGRNFSPATRGKIVTLFITNESSVSPWIVFLAMFIPIFATFLLLFAVTILFRNRHAWMKIEAEQNLTAINCGLLNSAKENPRPQRLNIQPTDHLVLHDLGVLPSPTEDEDDNEQQNSRGRINGPDEILSPTVQRSASDYFKAPIERFYEKRLRSTSNSHFRWKADLNISDFQQKDPLAMQKSGRRFYWTIIIVAIFYCIPVYQLILHYLRVLYRTGEYDICYYNNLCSHRLGLFVDFNHFWSNASYIIFGFAFIFFVSRRANSMNLVTRNRRLLANNKHKRTHSGTNSIEGDDLDDKAGFFKRCCGYSKIPARSDHGIPHNWGIFYALGIALAMEGVLSAAYHLCPNQSSFQFDTCFMYVISVLFLLQIYQFRHSAHFGANHTFLILAAFVLISVIGLMFEFQGEKAKQIYRWIFITLQFLTMLLLALYFYAIGYIRTTQDDKKLITDFGIFTNFGQLKDQKINGDRLFLPLISFCMGIAVLIYCELANIDFATYLLYVLVANVIGFTFYYVGIMKPLHGEFKNRTWVQPAIYFFGAGIIGGFAVTYFVRSPATWELSAAASREGNEECMKGWFPFYPYYGIIFIIIYIII